MSLLKHPFARIPMHSASQNILLPRSPISSSGRNITHPALHIRDAQDALIVFEAVRLHILPLITQRLNGNERSQLKSGDIFVWEESENKGALSRWTDGRRWSQSRMRGDYLWYQEQIDISQEERDAKAARRALKALDPTTPSSVASRRQDRPAKPGGLIKQTYSTLVRHSSGCKKWHIVAYFAEDDYLRLPTVNHYEYLRRIRVQEGIFLPGKGSTRRLDQPNTGSGEESGPSWLSSKAHGGSEQDYQDIDQYSSTRSISSSPVSANFPSRSASTDGERIRSLPRLSLITPNTQGMRESSRTTSTYLPRSSEDRKAIESFRVTL